MRIMYLTQWFDPEAGVFKGLRFARALQAAGHEVTVVTGFPNYPGGKLYPGYRLRPLMRETIDGVRVVRLPLYPSHDSSWLRRSLNYLSFFLSALAYGLFRRQRFDLAYVYHPPITVGLAAGLAGLVRPLPLVLDIQDLWPDTMPATGMIKAAGAMRLLDLMCRVVYRRASVIVVQSEGMRRALIDRGVPGAKITTVRNWAGVEPASEPAARPMPSGGFDVVYGGNLGRAQALETVIDAAAIIERGRQDIRVHLYGAGVDAASLQARAAQLGVTAVRFHPRIPPAEIRPIFAQADALLLHLADDPLFAITIPSKTQVYLAMGRPIVAGIAGEAAELLQQSGAALIAPPGNPQALAQAICALADMPLQQREAMGQAGARFYRENLSFERAMDQTLAVLQGARAR